MILDSRTRDAGGRRTIVFAAGHIGFRRSLLVRAADARRLARFRDLTGWDRVGVLAGTSGEARLLELPGIVDAAGVLAGGTFVETPAAVVVVDGGTGSVIGADGPSARLQGRHRLQPASGRYAASGLSGGGDGCHQSACGRADRRGRQGRDRQPGPGPCIGRRLRRCGAGSRAESGGFALAASDVALAACLDRQLAWLNDGGRMVSRSGSAIPGRSLQRARQRNGSK